MRTTINDDGEEVTGASDGAEVQWCRRLAGYCKETVELSLP